MDTAGGCWWLLVVVYMKKLTLQKQLDLALERVSKVKIYCDERDFKDACLHKAYNECEEIIKRMKKASFYRKLFY